MTTTQSPADMTTDDLYEALSQALAYGRFGEALAAADELCRVERAHECHDLLAAPMAWPMMQPFGAEMLQGLTDRIEQYNSHCH